MKVHISLNVNDIEKSVEFYSKMFNQKPMKFIEDKRRAHKAVNGGDVAVMEKVKTGYAKFDIANPPLNLALNETDHKSGGRLSHLGLQVETTEDVLSYREKWIAEGLITVDEMGVDCCYAKQDKTWVSDPDGNDWEVFVVLENLEKMEQGESCGCSDKVLEESEVARSGFVL